MESHIIGNNIQVDYNGDILTVHPPKMRTLNNLTHMSTDESKALETLADGLSALLSDNTDGQKISPEQVLDDLDIVEASELFQDLMDWIANIKKK